jgi:hypothetical protein
LPRSISRQPVGLDTIRPQRSQAHSTTINEDVTTMSNASRPIDQGGVTATLAQADRLRQFRHPSRAVFAASRQS